MRPTLLLIIVLVAALHVQADDYVIEQLNGNYITINGARLGKGARFHKEDSIRWNNSTVFYARNSRNGNVERFREEDFAKQQSASLWSYILKRNHGSSRACDDYCLCSVASDVFYLTDTIRLRTDDPRIIDYYLGRKTSLPQYFISYWFDGEVYNNPVPLDGDEILITRQILETVPAGQPIGITLYGMDEKGEKELVSDAMIIEKL